MTGIRIKWGNLDTDTHRGKPKWRDTGGADRGKPRRDLEQILPSHSALRRTSPANALILDL